MISSIAVFIYMDGMRIVNNWPEEELEGPSKYLYCCSRRLKWWKSVLPEILLSLLDSLLDIIYFFRILNRKSLKGLNQLVTVPTWVYKTMLSSLFLAIPKEAAVVYWTLDWHENGEFRNGELGKNIKNK